MTVVNIDKGGYGARAHASVIKMKRKQKKIGWEIKNGKLMWRMYLLMILGKFSTVT